MVSTFGGTSPARGSASAEVPRLPGRRLGRRGSALLGIITLLLLPSCKEEHVAPPPPPPQVKVAEVLVQDVPVYAEAIGETRGNSEIEIRARVEGFIETVDYLEGSLVKKGDLLYTIDARPFQASLAQAKAGLAEAEAQLARAHQDVVRYEPLVAKNAISREEYETAVAIERAASAAVDAEKALVEQAEIDLSYTRVLAPDDGLAGKTEVFPGTLVGRGQSTLLTRISKIDPIHVRASFAEREYLAYARKRGTGTPTTEQLDGSPVPFELVLADGTVLPTEGRLVYIDRSVDPRTATIMLEAAFPNPANIVRPGQYAMLRARTDLRQGAILIPQRAVREIQGIHMVMVVGTGDVAEQRPVVPGERVGALWVIESGLAAGDRIVVEGIQKARPGAKVVPETVPIEVDPAPAGGAPPGKPAEGGTPAEPPAGKTPGGPAATGSGGKP